MNFSDLIYFYLFYSLSEVFQDLFRFFQAFTAEKLLIKTIYTYRGNLRGAGAQTCDCDCVGSTFNQLNEIFNNFFFRCGNEAKHGVSSASQQVMPQNIFRKETEQS